MSYILMLLAGFVLALALIMLASLWYMRLLLDKMVFSKHRDLDAITSTGAVPEAWSYKYERKMIRLRTASRQQRVDRVRSAARRSYLRKLSRLTGYVRRSRFIQNEETRNFALRKLQMLDREWRAAPDESVS